MRVTVNSKGQVTLPVEARRRLGIQAGARLEVLVVQENRLELVRTGGSLRDLKNVLPKPERALSLADMDDAIAQGASSAAPRT